MTLKSQSLVLLTALSLLSTLLLSDASAALGEQHAAAPLGGWQPIDNVTALEVQETAQFAIIEHNKQTNSMLKYKSVVQGEYQVVSGVNYRLLIAAKTGGVDGKYEAVVYVKAWEKYRKLTSFRKVRGNMSPTDLMKGDVI